jgi:hypothetical protein
MQHTRDSLHGLDENMEFLDKTVVRHVSINVANTKSTVSV